MKKLSRIIALMLVALMFVLVLPTAAFAATATTITSGKAIALKDYKSGANLYKLTVEEDSLVKIAWTKNTAQKANITLYKNTAMSKYIKGVLYSNDATSGQMTLALSKGTYYAQMYDGYSTDSEKPTTKVTFTVTKTVNKTNYCKVKAVSLASGTNVKIGQTRSYNYDRWYKIKLSAKKVITVTTNKGQGYSVKLYDANGNKIQCTNGDKKVVTEDKQPAGTYYICVSADDYLYSASSNASYGLGTYISVKWN